MTRHRFRIGGENERYIRHNRRLREAKERARERFRQAATFVLPFGKHKGRTLDEVAETDDGLRYLDWVRGVRDAQAKCDAEELCIGLSFLGKRSPLDEALAAYLDDESIQADLREALDGHG